MNLESLFQYLGKLIRLHGSTVLIPTGIGFVLGATALYYWDDHRIQVVQNASALAHQEASTNKAAFDLETKKHADLQRSFDSLTATYIHEHEFAGKATL